MIQRFALPTTLNATITNVNGVSSYQLNETLKRGQRIETTDDELAFTIGEETKIYLAQRTNLELVRLYEDELVVLLTKGRIVVDAQSPTPLIVRTHHTEHLVYQDTASFVNYDFLETVHVIPLTGSVQTAIKETNEHLLTPVPIAIHETDPISYDTLEVNLAAGDSADFYRWAGVLKE